MSATYHVVGSYPTWYVEQLVGYNWVKISQHSSVSEAINHISYLREVLPKLPL